MQWLQSVALCFTAIAVGTAHSQSAPPFPSACAGATASSTYKLGVADGWKYTLVASGLKTPRGVVFDSAGNLLVLQAGLGLTVHGIGTDGCLNSTKTIISNAQLNHGLALSPDGKMLYVSSATTAWSYVYDPTTRAVSNQTVLVNSMSRSGHVTRTLAIPPNNSSLLIVSCGSNGNFDYPSTNKETGRAIVKVFDLTKTPAGGYNYNSQGWYLGYGLRNEIGIIFDGNNMVWGVENSGDQLTRNAGGTSTDVHIDNPAEELNYLGDPSNSNEQWYGYPTCWTAGDPSVIKDNTLKVGQQFVVAPNSTFNDTSCAQKAVPPRLSIQAHSAPIDGKFNSNFTNLYVSLHGSWNRQPATGYKVIEIAFQRNSTGAYEPVLPADTPISKAYTDILWTQNVGSCNGQTCLRPTGITWDPAWSRMYVASDGAVGELYILAKA